MEINISQNKISVSDKYQIYIEGQKKYFASAKLFRLLSEINLFNYTENKTENNAVFIIKKKWNWFKTTYDLRRFDNNVFEFTTKNMWKRHYNCIVGQDNYEIFGHNGRKYSIYKNDKQVAWWDKESVSWFNGDNYKIIADNDCDYCIIISFCLVIDNSASNDNDGNMVTIDLGNFGSQAKEFDKNWQPNKNIQ